MTRSITLTGITLPIFKSMLSNLAHCLDKAVANAQQRNFNPDVFVTQRLAPDMLPFASQIRIACDMVKNGSARVSGIEAPAFSDDETTFAQLQERINKTLAWINTLPADAFDGLEEKEITFPAGKDVTRTMPAAAYLTTMILPNLYFHVVTAYNLLRQGGVDLGKMDYILGKQANQ